jgi:hypothetical protein
LLFEPNSKVPQNLLPTVLGGQTCLIRRIRTPTPMNRMQGSRSHADAVTFVAPAVT